MIISELLIKTITQIMVFDQFGSFMKSMKKKRETGREAARETRAWCRKRKAVSQETKGCDSEKEQVCILGKKGFFSA